MKTLGLTGGIGMGKSTAAEWLHQRGVPVVDSDQLAREVVEPGQPALAEIQQTFGEDMVGPDGRLRRDLLADIVFADLASRRKLEEITHPRIGDLWRARVETWRAEGHALAAVVIPLLFEIEAQTECDATICVACSTWTQHQRLLPRGWSLEQIRQRVQAQWPADKKMELADYVVWNEGGLEILRAQMARILERLWPAGPKPVSA